MIHLEQHGPVTAIRMARSLLGRPVYWTAAYWVDGLLIDSGPACTANELARLLADMGVNQIVVTHSHEDHIGGLRRLQQRYPHAPIYAPRGALPLLEDPSKLRMQFYRRAIWGEPRPVHGARSLDEVEDVLATPSYSFRVIETPGHSLEHISLFEPNQRWLFCGDAFIGGQDRAWAQEYDMFGVISSLRALASLRPERMFPGSGSVRRTPLPEIHEKIGALTRLSEQVAEREAAGASVADMVADLLGGEPRFRPWTGGHFSAANLIRACRSYNILVAPGNGKGGRPTAAEQHNTAADTLGPSESRSTGRTV
jgi:glyoxylase-like metal-dependent hydrolase (beta-lactamase superfamily II)